MKVPMAYEQYCLTPKRVATEDEVKEVKTTIKACILTHKNGLPSSDLRDAYKTITDEEIPVYKLGYNSLFHLLRDIPEVQSSRNDIGKPVLIVKPSSKTQHLQDMIKKQKDPKTCMRNYNPSKRKDERKRISEEKKVTRQKFYDQNRDISMEKKSTGPPVDENWGRPTIHIIPNFEDNKIVYTDPVVGTSQLIGDDYFLQLCIKYLSVPLVRKHSKAAITCGTVQSGLTIRKATERFDKIKIMSNKLVINVGTVDIYRRRTDEEMIRDYKKLLNKLSTKYGYAPSQITICTLPPMGNVGLFCESKKYANYLSFNKWMRKFAWDNGYNILDFQCEFTDESMIIDYECFQQDARRVSGTIHSHVLWNYHGRQKAMKLLYNL